MKTKNKFNKKYYFTEDIKMLKKYLLLLTIFILVFGCKNKVSYDGILMHRNDLPFIYATDLSDIFLKTSINDKDFTDGVRYYRVIPKKKHSQDFFNNLGRKVTVRGEESISISGEEPMVNILPPEEIPPEESEQKPYLNINRYNLEEAKIIKVY